MPELPEIETTIREMKQAGIPGMRIRDIWTDFPKMVHLMSKEKAFKKGKEKYFFDVLRQKVKNKVIEKIWRKGKNILFDLSGGLTLLLHQKLTGHLLYGMWVFKHGKWVPLQPGPLSDKMNSYIHFIFFLSNGKMLSLSDPRKFAKIELWSTQDFQKSDVYNRLGKDPFDISIREFQDTLKKKNIPIKKVLMDQNFIAGIGNIYSSEILFAAKIHPLKKASSLNTEEISALYKYMRSILKKAIEVKGESISDYRTLKGEKGGFDRLRKVYRREICPRCGARIKRIEIGGRSAYYCPVCQRL